MRMCIILQAARDESVIALLQGAAADAIRQRIKRDDEERERLAKAALDENASDAQREVYKCITCQHPV